MNLSLLQNFTEKNFFLKPFPHLIIKNALPKKLYNDLNSSFPIDKFKSLDLKLDGTAALISESNKKLCLTPEKIKEDNEIDHLWKNFISFNKSETFTHQILDIFSKNIVETYLDTYKSEKELYKLKVEKDGNKDADLFPYIEISINTPVLKKSSVIDIHADNPNKLVTALFYMREKDDFSGGDLILHGWRIKLPNFLKKIILSKKKSFFNNIIRKYNFLFIKDSKRIKYFSNTLVMYFDSIDSLHSVTQRDITEKYRKFCFFSLRIKYKKYLYKPYFGQSEINT